MIEMNTIYQGDCLEIMNGWPEGCVQCCVTSPPYWGLRDYGVEGQLGLEKTPEEYIEKMVAVFREVKRVLRDDGTLWLNIGDSYVSGKGRYSSCPQSISGKERNEPMNGNRPDLKGHAYLKDKDLAGIPWRLAFALQADGWYLRQDIIWHKPNPMPESVTDRCTKSHEYIFLLTKRAKYFYDNEAIKEDAVETNDARPRMGQGTNTSYNQKRGYVSKEGENGLIPSRHGQNITTGGKKNKRSVWTIPTEAFAEAHFATFPRKLVEPCVSAGTSAKGCCSKCGSPRERITKASEEYSKNLGTWQVPKTDKLVHNKAGKPSICSDYETVGWQPTCDCNAEVVPCVVFDPFMGSGTTAQVAYELGRNYIGCELNAEYLKFNRAEKAKEKLGLFEKG